MAAVKALTMSASGREGIPCSGKLGTWMKPTRTALPPQRCGRINRVSLQTDFLEDGNGGGQGAYDAGQRQGRRALLGQIGYMDETHAHSAAVAAVQQGK